jgi:hypothetical protein
VVKAQAVVLLLLSFSVLAQETNTQTGDLNTNTQNSTVSSNNTTNSKTYNGAGSSGMPVTSTISPSLMSSGNDSCLRSTVGGVQLTIIGVSAGKYYQDLECNRRKDSKTLKELGMGVASVALMCQKVEVWLAMFTAGTPCPVLANSRLVVGKNAYLVMRKNPSLYIPTYEEDKDFYNTLLGIGNEIQTDDSDTRSISERFRSSKRD